MIQNNPKFHSTINPNPNADTEADLKYRQVVAKFEEDQKIIRAMLDNLSMSVKQEDKEILPIVQILSKNSLRIEEMGVVFNLQSKLCKNITGKIDANLAAAHQELHARVSILEDKGTFKYMFGRVKLIEEAVRSLIYLGAALLAVYSILP